MRDYEMIRLQKEVDKICNSQQLNNKKIYLFGAGDYSRNIYQLLKAKGLEVEAIIDNDKSKQGGYCSGLRIIGLEEALRCQNGSVRYMVCSDFWREMVKQLQTKGGKKEEIIVIKKRKDTLTEKIATAYNGKKYYDELVKKYGKTKIFLCPYTGTGDIYLIGTFWKQYTEYYHITDYVFLVLSKACYRVAELFPIENLVLLDKMKDAENLIAYYLLKKEEMDMVILNDGWRELPYSRTEWLRGYKGLYFTELFRKFVFKLPDDIKPEHPELPDYDREINDLFSLNGLIPGRTVVISPYSNTLLDLPDEFWTDIVERLVACGYTVCTNCGSDTELPIAGTKGIFVKLNMAPQFVNHAGFFIGVRSGFCDVISGTSAKKVILYYDRNRFYGASAYDYFNLKNMELCEDALELQFSKDSIQDMIQKVIEWL